MPDHRNRHTTSRYAAERAKEKKRRGKWIAALLILCLLLGGYFVLQEFLIFTPEGIRLALPGREEPAPADTVTAVAPPLSEPMEKGQEPEISIDKGELPPATRGHIRGAALAVSGRTREEIAADALALHEAGCTAAVVSLKTAEDPAAAREELAWAKDACRDARLRMTVYISCFRDDVTAREDEALALRDSGGRLFIDYRYCAWLDPESPEVQARILDLCRLAEDCGAELILLDELCYPYEGNVDTIDYSRSTASPRDVITAFARELGDAVEVPLGAVIGGDDTLGEGASERRGQDVTVFAACFDSLWVRADSLNGARTLQRRVAALTDAEFGAVVDGVWMEAVYLAP